MRWTGTILILAVAAAPVWGFTLVDNSSGPSIAICPCCISILNPYPVQYLPAGGADVAGTVGTMGVDFPGCTVAVGGAAPGTLTVDQYYAWCKGRMCGAYLSARYDDGDGANDWALPWPFAPAGTPSYRWIQEINTNKPLGGATQPYIDPRPNDDPGGMALPYYWTDNEAITRYTNGATAAGNYDLRFSDRPSRECTQWVYWFADLFVVSENRFTIPGADPLHVITVHDGIRWGFECFPSIGKLIGLRAYSFIFQSIPEPLEWSTQPIVSQLHGPATMATLFPAGAHTMLPGETQSDYVEMFEAVHGDFYGANEYSFSVSTEDGLYNCDVLLRELEHQRLWDVEVPVVRTPGVTNLCMTVNLEKDWLIITDKYMPEDREAYLEPLYAGSYEAFVADPYGCGFDVMGTATLQLDNVWFPAPGEVPPGDANIDQLVDGADYTIWADNYQTERSNWDLGDFNNDGIVEGADYTIWADNYTPWSPGKGMPVPEPATLCLLAVGGWLAVRRRCRS